MVQRQHDGRRGVVEDGRPRARGQAVGDGMLKPSKGGATIKEGRFGVVGANGGSVKVQKLPHRRRVGGIGMLASRQRPTRRDEDGISADGLIRGG